jgi:hypothetical protein
MKPTAPPVFSHAPPVVSEEGPVQLPGYEFYKVEDNLKDLTFPHSPGRLIHIHDD